MDSLAGRGGGRRRRTYRPGRLGGRANRGGEWSGGREEVVVGRAAVRVGPAQVPERLFIWAPISAPVPFASNIHRVPRARRLSLGLHNKLLTVH